MKKFAAKEIEVIKKLATEEIPAMIAAGTTEDQYNAKRADLNAHIIQFAVGGEIIELKGKKAGQNTFKFNKGLPTKAQIADVADVVNTFIANVENPYLLSLNKADGIDDMDIPTGDVYAANVKPLEKARNKELRAKILGTEGVAYYQMKLSGLDVITLAGIGEEARKRANFTTAIIVGGIVVVLAGAGVAGYLIYENKKNKEEEPAVDTDDIVDVDPDEVDIDPDDAPEVVLD